MQLWTSYRTSAGLLVLLHSFAIYNTYTHGVSLKITIIDTAASVVVIGIGSLTVPWAINIVSFWAHAAKWHCSKPSFKSYAFLSYIYIGWCNMEDAS